MTYLYAGIRKSELTAINHSKLCRCYLTKGNILNLDTNNLNYEPSNKCIKLRKILL